MVAIESPKERDIRKSLSILGIAPHNMEYSLPTYLTIVYDGVKKEPDDKKPGDKKPDDKNHEQDDMEAKYLPQGKLKRKISKFMTNIGYNVPNDYRLNNALDSLWRNGVIIPVERGSSDPDIFSNIQGRSKTWIAVHPAMLKHYEKKDFLFKKAAGVENDLKSNKLSSNFKHKCEREDFFRSKSGLNTEGNDINGQLIGRYNLNLKKEHEENIYRKDREIKIYKDAFYSFDSEINPPGSDPNFNYWFRIKGPCTFSSLTYFKSVAMILCSVIYEAFFDVATSKIKINIFTGTGRIEEMANSLLLPLKNSGDKDAPKVIYNFYSENRKYMRWANFLSKILKIWSIEIYRKNEPKILHFGAVATPFHPGYRGEMQYSTVFYLQRREFHNFCLDFFKNFEKEALINI